MKNTTQIYCLCPVFIAYVLAYVLPRNSGLLWGRAPIN